MSSEARFKFSVGESLLELEGSEEFVAKHIGDFKEIVVNMSTKSHEKASKPEETRPDSEHIRTVVEDPIDQVKTKNGEPEKGETISSYPHVYSEIGGKLKITTSIPGTSSINQMTNAALLYCYGRSLMGQIEVPHKVIRKVCEDHGILNGPNFAKIFNDKTLFLTEGKKGGNKDVKLTYKGNAQAQQLIKNVK